jgi:DNA-binding NtrC family response regulator
VSEPILYIGRDGANARLLQSALRSKGYELLCAFDAKEAAELIRTRLLHAVCVDGRAMDEGESSTLGESLKSARSRVPMVLIKTCNAGQPNCLEEHADAVTDVGAFLRSAHGMIGELRAARFPVFTQWFEKWKQRSAA